MVVRRLPIGAEVQPDGTIHVRVWAPNAKTTHVVLESGAKRGASVALHLDADGYHHGVISGGARTAYRFRLDNSPDLLPDPASRFQPEGPFGPSMAIDPTSFRWTDDRWAGIDPSRVVAYEMHVGTFTREGTWRAAAERLADLAELGVTVIEMMPVADFAGRFGWGYDGVNLFAPTRLYGAPDDLRAFVDRAHGVGLGVVLDVVYNHFGPAGAFADRFSGRYFSASDTEWGRAINFDGESSAPVREFFVSNAGYWIDEFHFDGLRLDATQTILDRSPRHIVAEVARRVREGAGSRSTWIVAENERQESVMARPVARGGYGVDALWNDDYHHTAVVALTGRREAYYTDYGGRPQEFISAARHGFLYQGQWYRWQSQRRGQPSLDLPPAAFVAFLENHDQVANSGNGSRLHQLASPARYRALLALTLLGPWTPMLFQGQEFASSAPFLFFADHDAELAAAVRRGRAEFLSQFPRLALPEVQRSLADPADVSTFERCKLDHPERDRHRAAWALHADLLRLRREDPILAGHAPHGVDGAVLTSSAFVLRFFGDGRAADRLLLVNLGMDETMPIVPEPLLAPPCAHRWALRWSSEAVEYGGAGTPVVEANPGWQLPRECTLLFEALPEAAHDARR